MTDLTAKLASEVERVAAPNKRSTLALVTTVIPFAAALATVWFIGGQVVEKKHDLEKVNLEIQAKKHELDGIQSERNSTESQLKTAKADLSRTQGELDTLVAQKKAVQDLVAESPQNPLAKRIAMVLPAPAPASPAAATPAPILAGPPLQQEARVQMSLSPTDKTTGGHPVYKVRIWVELPQGRTSEVAKVDYDFDAPEFFGSKPMPSYDSKNGFLLAYEGWGCVSHPAAILVGRDGSKHRVPFDMCGMWESAKQRSAKQQ